MASNFEEISKQFVAFYYQQFDSDRTNLAALYRQNSMLTFENSQYMGTQNIIKQLTELPFGKVQHRVDTTDTQPLNEQGGIVVMVTGALQLEGQERPMSYVQTFTLQPEGGSYYVQNDLFRLVYPAA